MGNALRKDYVIGDQCASGGPGYLWRVYPAVKKSTKEPVSIFLFDKRTIKDQPKPMQAQVLETLRAEAKTLAKMRHPQVLRVLVPVKENKHMLVMVTEPVSMSLANACRNLSNMDNVPDEVMNYEMSPQELKCGLQQLAEALLFTHEEARTVHRNVTPETCYITPAGVWKLAGFNFSSPLDTAQKPLLETSEHDEVSPFQLQPTLNAAAPEHLSSTAYGSPVDAFSFGCLMWALFNGGRPLLHTNENALTHRMLVEKFPAGIDLQRVPAELREALVAVLATDAGSRMDMATLIETPYFHDVVPRVLRYLDVVDEKELDSRVTFYKALPQVLPQIEEKMIRVKLLPNLVRALNDAAVTMLVIPNLMTVAKREAAKKSEFRDVIFPAVRKLLHSREPTEAVALLFQDLHFIVCHLTKEDFRDEVMPVIVWALQREEDVNMLTVVLSQLAAVASVVDYVKLKNEVLPQMQVLALNAPTLGVRIKALHALSLFFHLFDRVTIVDDLIPFLRDCIEIEKSPGMMMAVLGVFSAISKKLKARVTAEHILPFILPLAYTPRLDTVQLDMFVRVVRQMVDKVADERSDEVRKEVEEREAKAKATPVSDMDRFEAEVGHRTVRSASSAAAVPVSLVPSPIGDDGDLGGQDAPAQFVAAAPSETSSDGAAAAVAPAVAVAATAGIVLKPDAKHAPVPDDPVQISTGTEGASDPWAMMGMMMIGAPPAAGAAAASAAEAARKTDAELIDQFDGLLDRNTDAKQAPVGRFTTTSPTLLDAFEDDADGWDDFNGPKQLEEHSLPEQAGGRLQTTDGLAHGVALPTAGSDSDEDVDGLDHVEDDALVGFLPPPPQSAAGDDPFSLGVDFDPRK